MYDGRAIVWERATGREVARFEGHQRGTVLSLDYSPDGTHIVTSGRDGSVRVWDAETGVQLYELPERVEPVSRLSSPPDAPSNMCRIPPVETAFLRSRIRSPSMYSNSGTMQHRAEPGLRSTAKSVPRPGLRMADASPR